MNSQASATVNPFDDDRHSFLVLVNPRGEYSLWPTFAAEPIGWLSVYGPAERTACMEWVDSHWAAQQNAASMH